MSCLLYTLLEQSPIIVCQSFHNSNICDTDGDLAKDRITLIGYAFLYNIGEILCTPMQNLSYIYGKAGFDTAYPYAMLLSHTI